MPESLPPVALFALIESGLDTSNQAAIAKRIGISRSLYGMWRSGKFNLSSWQLLQIHDLFKLDWSDVIAALRDQYPPEVIAEIKAKYLTPEFDKKVKKKGKKV